eukprot:TRINITY_DN54948_c0_g1_i1.p1 TRINITY_DN54948_c0_g1~~TRINITY_DN54948_c0_g1_i1.p1  ORF type:complete len:134 (+),score=4.87 TRINITY_DN54948_c0_g1_i1:72-473(+)
MYVASVLSFFVLGLSFQSCSFLSNTHEGCVARYSGVAAYRMKWRNNRISSYLSLGGRSTQPTISLLDLDGYRMSSNESATHELNLSRSRILNMEQLKVVVITAFIVCTCLICAIFCFAGVESSGESAETEELG